MWFQDVIQTSSRGCPTPGAYGVEDSLYVSGAGNVFVRWRVWGVEEMDVDPVGVMGGADWCYAS